MQAYLTSPSLGRLVEVRSTDQLHDRLLLSDDGDVLTVGTSLNGVGRTTTVMTPIPSPARESLRAEYEQIWSEARLVSLGRPPLSKKTGMTTTLTIRSQGTLRGKSTTTLSRFGGRRGLEGTRSSCH